MPGRMPALNQICDGEKKINEPLEVGLVARLVLWRAGVKRGRWNS